MNKMKAVIAGIIASGLVLGASACTQPSQEYQDRKEQQEVTTLKDSLEITNLKEKLERENDAAAVRYVYLISFAQPIGYYVIKGKVSSSGSQQAPEQEVLRPYSGVYLTLDSAQDDGTYGTGDPGIFFFLANGTMVSTTLDYVESDAPLPIDVPRLGGTE